MVDSETPDLDVLVSIARKYFFAVEAKSLKCDSLRYAFAAAVLHLPQGFIMRAASSSSRRFPYLKDELRGIDPIGARSRAAKHYLKAIVVWRLMNDPAIRELVESHGFAFTDRGSIATPTPAQRSQRWVKLAGERRH